MLRNVSREAELEWLTTIYTGRFAQPDINYFKVVEIETGKLVAWAGLSWPWDMLDLSQEEKNSVHKTPSLPDGIDVELAAKVFGRLLFGSRNFGFDVEKHFHRRGTFVHPSYQKRRFATQLTLVCNEIADLAGRRTFVGARETSLHLFESHGFVKLGDVTIDTTKYGGKPGGGLGWITAREPKSRVKESEVEG